MKSFTDEKSICFDLETLGKNPGCIVVSIGATKFNFETGIVDKFKVNISPESAKSFGLKAEKDTMDWWLTQSKESRKGWTENAQPLDEAINQFTEWMNIQNEMYLWVNGASFDYPILRECYYALGQTLPWHYRQEMCMRTVFNMMGYSNSAARQKEGDYHDSLGDAISQTNALISFFKS
jgi:DNA polymerase III epsilon subunit-like protein